jgi:hypothetical protein
MTASHASGPVRTDAVADTDGGYIYDAFISYSGFRKTGDESRFDRQVAERLHRALETYRVPRALTKRAPGGGSLPRRLKKIFRDRDEVRASSNLNSSLTEALRRSRFLIVICSPRARQSLWMNQEIATFRSLGRGEQILPLLIEGEPAEAFPEELLGARPEPPTRTHEAWLAQPLAADIRAPSVSKSLRLLTEEKLRLLAAILGCEYDDLRQREHERFVRRVTGAGAAMLAGLLVLMTLSLLLYFARQREQRNKHLALRTAAAILPLTGLDPDSPYGANDPEIRERYMGIAISSLETIRQDDPENLAGLTTLKSLHATRSFLFRAQGREAEAREDFEQAVSLVIPIAVSRLRAWRPTAHERVEELSGETLSFPKNYDLDRLRNLLMSMELPEGPAVSKQAVEYSERVAEYLPLLDTSTREGKAAARHALQFNLKQFEQARSRAALTRPEEDLVEAIEEALARLPPDN